MTHRCGMTRSWHVTVLLTIIVAGVVRPCQADPAKAQAKPHVTLQLILVRQTELCPTGYARTGQDCGPVTADDVAELEQNHLVSPPYELVEHKPVPITLPPQFQQALMAAIDAGGYAVLLIFDWGQPTAAVVDLVRKAELLPNWSNKHKVFHTHRHWYTHQNANAFDPSQAAIWQVSMNGYRLFAFHVKR